MTINRTALEEIRKKKDNSKVNNVGLRPRNECRTSKLNRSVDHSAKTGS
jgi:hypothetical protein